MADQLIIDASTASLIVQTNPAAVIDVGPAPGSTDALPEGLTNLYHTTARAADAAPVQSVAGRDGDVVLAIADVENLQSELDGKLSTPDQGLNSTDTVQFAGIAINGVSTGGSNDAVFRGQTFFGNVDGSIGTGVEALPIGTFSSAVPFLSFTGFNQSVTQYNSFGFTSGFYPQVFMHTNGNVGIQTADPLARLDVAGNIQACNGATATQIQVHNTYTSTTNFERGFIRWSGNTFRIGTDKGSGGGTARSMEFRTDDTIRLTIGATGSFTIADAQNIAVGTTTGTKIGTATTQKIGFFNATPVVQPTAVANATDAATVITQLNALLARLRTLGLIAT